MENNPVDTSAFTHFLLFESLGHETPYQIFEPSGFKEIAYSVNQKPEAFGRDYSYIASGDKALRFNNNIGERGPKQQVVNPQGEVSQFLDSGLAWILESRRRFGFESKIRYILFKNNIPLDTGYLSCILPDTDGYTYFGCNIIQDSLIGDYKRQESTVIDLFSEKNFRNETITPIQVLKFLRKSVPFYQDSSWSRTGSSSFKLLSGAFISINRTTTKENINNTLSSNTDVIRFNAAFESPWSQFTFAQWNAGAFEDIDTVTSDGKGMKLLIAKRTFSSTKITARFKGSIRGVVEGLTIDGPVSFCYIAMASTEGSFQDDFDAGKFVKVFEFVVPERPSDWYDIDETQFAYLPEPVPIGKTVYGGWTVLVPGTLEHNGFSNARISVSVQESEISAEVQASAINTVVFGARYIDVMKQCSKFINNVPVNAPRFDVGGEFYDQACFSRSLVSQNTSIPFVTTFGDCFNSVQEVCGDFENKVDEIFVGQFPDFYENKEIGVFEIKPNSETKEPYNERILIKGFEIGFEKYQDDSNLGQNTLQDVHTEAKWIIPNEMAINTLERKFKYTRSGYAQQKAVDLEISKPTTSDSTDDDVYLLDLFPLEDGTSDTFGAILSVNITGGNVTLLNKTSDGDDNDVVINWSVLGFSVGSTFEIISGANVGVYTVTEITRSLLTITPVGFTPTEKGDLFVEVKYFYSDVFFQTRTTEGFDLVEGLFDSSRQPNLRFTPRRCMVHFESLLNTACTFVRDKVIQNSYFKNNGKLKTQFMGGPIYIENEKHPEDPSLNGIKVTTLQDRIIGTLEPEIECFCTYDEAVTFLQNYRTTRGFIRAFDSADNIIKGFVKNFEFLFATDTLKLTLEEKFEPVVLVLNYALGILTVNGTIYDLGGISEWWKLENGYFKAYDKDNIPVCNWKMYDEVSLNGNIYGSSNELLTALSGL